LTYAAGRLKIVTTIRAYFQSRTRIRRLSRHTRLPEWELLHCCASLPSPGSPMPMGNMFYAAWLQLAALPEWIVLVGVSAAALLLAGAVRQTARQGGA
jgi:hypothetical protein